MIDKLNQPAGRWRVVTIGMGTSVAMWAIGYVCRIPPVLVPSPAVLALLVIALGFGGTCATRHGGRVGDAAAVGFVSGVVNLLILGSLVGDAGADVPSMALWIPGFLLASVAIATLGGTLARLGEIRDEASLEETQQFYGRIGVVATLFVVIAGGLVTSYRAGLAVPDWPNSFGSNMFLYPLAKMTGGIYYEHAHRLYGALVGLTTVVFAVFLHRTDPRPWVRKLGIAAAIMVTVQGLMGGVRVTGSLTLAENPATEPSHALAILHGIFGQVFFVTMCGLAVVVSIPWKRAGVAALEQLRMAPLFVGALIAQLTFGALARHLATPEQPLNLWAMVHMTLALVIVVIAYLVGANARTSDEAHPAIRSAGTAIIGIVTVQVLLGITAMLVVINEGEETSAWEALATTAHQANGALLLGAAGFLLVWSKRPLPTGTTRA